MQYEALRRRQPEDAKIKSIKLVLTALPTLLFMIFITVSNNDVSPVVIENLNRQTQSYHVLNKMESEYATFHLKHNFDENYRAQRLRGRFGTRVTDVRIDRVVMPAAFVLFIVTALILINNRFFITLAVLPFAVFAPLIIHLVAWDTSRFTNFTIFHGFICYSAACFMLDNKLERWMNPVIIFLSLLAIFSNFYFDVPLMSSKIDWHGLFEFNRL
jgi:hypothetical protein